MVEIQNFLKIVVEIQNFLKIVEISNFLKIVVEIQNFLKIVVEISNFGNGGRNLIFLKVVVANFKIVVIVNLNFLKIMVDTISWLISKYVTQKRIYFQSNCMQNVKNRCTRRNCSIT